MTTKMILIATLISFLNWSDSVVAQKSMHVTESLDYAVFLENAAPMHDAVALASSELIEEPGASWLQLQFDNWNLSGKSYIKITSEEDGAVQILDSVSILNYRGQSAYFNGDAVRVELYADPVVSSSFINIDKLHTHSRDNVHTPSAEKILSGYSPPNVETICDTFDNRTTFIDPAIGRNPSTDCDGDNKSGCTSFIVSNGALLTAGHCGPGNGALISFNVPASDPDGCLNFPSPDDQYAVDGATVIDTSNGLGDDWSVFQCSPNSNTGLLPYQGQNAFYRMTQETDITGDIRITGYGWDDEPFGSENWNEDHKVLQTNTGSYEGETGSGTVIYHSYRADTRDANSGSPVIWDSRNITIGIHAQGGCDSTGGANNGTSFNHSVLATNIHSAIGANAVYVDGNFPLNVAEDGSVFRPFSSVTDAVAEAQNGSLVGIVRGTYNESIQITKPLRIIPVVGPVAIGPNAALSSKRHSGLASHFPRGEVGAKQVNTEPVENIPNSGALTIDVPTVFALKNAYPNPFNPRTTIQYDLPASAQVRLIVYDILGRQVKELVSAQMPPGFHQIQWDGTNYHAQNVSSGTYIYRLMARDPQRGKTPIFVETKTMMLVR